MLVFEMTAFANLEFVILHQFLLSKIHTLCDVIVRIWMVNYFLITFTTSSSAMVMADVIALKQSTERVPATPATKRLAPSFDLSIVVPFKRVHYSLCFSRETKKIYPT